MSNKKEKKNTTKNTSRTKKIPMLKLDNEKKIPARIVYMNCIIVILNVLELMT